MIDPITVSPSGFAKYKDIGGDRLACARHVLNDDLRVSGDVLGNVGGNNTRPLVVESSGSRAGDNPERLSLVKRFLLTFARRAEQQDTDHGER